MNIKGMDFGNTKKLCFLFQVKVGFNMYFMSLYFLQMYVNMFMNKII